MSKADKTGFFQIVRYFVGRPIPVYSEKIDINSLINNLEFTKKSDPRYFYRVILKQIIESLESPHNCKMVSNYIEEIGDTSYDQFTTEEVMSRIGENSKTVRLLRAVNQVIISSGAYHIKMLLKSKEITTGDISGPSGWRIVILLQKQQINVYHYRREKGLFEYDGFWFEWVQTMTFERDLNTLLSCGLSITDLHFNGNVTVEKQNIISEVLQQGNVILY